MSLLSQLHSHIRAVINPTRISQSTDLLHWAGISITHTVDCAPTPYTPIFTINTNADDCSLRAWIDQPLQILYFESRSAHEQDAEAQGTAGGLGVEREEKDVEPVGWMERWDERIRDVGYKVCILTSLLVLIISPWTRPPL